MNIKSKLLTAGSALLFSATMAFGAITSDQLAAQFQADGYSYITIKTGLTQIKVEAVKNGILYEVVYDIETGATIDTSTEVIGTIGRPDPGVIVRLMSRDFEDDLDGDDDEIGDDDDDLDDLDDDLDDDLEDDDLEDDDDSDDDLDDDEDDDLDDEDDSDEDDDNDDDGDDD